MKCCEGGNDEIYLCGMPEPGSKLEEILREESSIMINSGDRQIWLSFDYWLNPDRISFYYLEQDLPNVLVSMLDKWKAKAKAMEENFEACWYEKYASLKFIWWNRFYVIDGATFGVTDELFCALSVEIERELDAAGCPFHRYTGMID